MHCGFVPTLLCAHSFLYDTSCTGAYCCSYPGWQVAGPYSGDQLRAALSNLRASNEELRKYVQELKYEVEAQKQAMSKTERQKVRHSSTYRLHVVAPAVL